MRLMLFPVWLLCFAACDESIDITGRVQPIPVVYCFLSPDDSIQVLRLSKTFGGDADTTGLPPDPEDMVYNPVPEIFLAGDILPEMQQFYPCKQNQNISKDSGWFPMTGAQVFEAKCKIQPSTRYTLLLYFKDESRIVFAETVSPASDFKVIDPIPVPGREVDLFSGRDYYIRFNPVANAHIYQTKVEFIFDEIRLGERTRRSVYVQLVPDFIENLAPLFVEQRFSAAEFYRAVTSSVYSDPEISRIPVGFTFHVACGGYELATYVKSQTVINSFSEIDYTNLSNARGLFSFIIHRKIENLPLSRWTIDSLAFGERTKNLGFLPYKDIISYEK